MKFHLGFCNTPRPSMIYGNILMLFMKPFKFFGYKSYMVKFRRLLITETCEARVIGICSYMACHAGKNTV